MITRLNGIGMILVFACGLLLSLLSSGVARADSLAFVDAPPHRPRICLALSGGGARGYAHIGVLRELERLHVPVDCIAGTSMGAVVGSLYASGMTADEIEHALSELNLNDVAFDREARQGLPQTSREDDLLYPIGVPVGFGNGQFKFPNGLVQGNQLMALLRAHTAEIPGDVDFDKLPIPYRAVATDLETGDRVVLNHGSLPLAARASMAVPGLFAPEVIDGRTLIDGGTSSNLPIDVARQMGADIVIAVDIGTQLKRADQITSMTAVTSQMVRLMMTQNVRAQKASLRASDILLEPDLGSISFSDFGEMKTAVQSGVTSAQRSDARLGALSVSATQYASWRANLARDVQLPPGTRIDRVEIAAHGRVPASRVKQALNVKAGDIYDAAKVDDQLAELTRTGDFESVSHTFAGPPGDRMLQVEANAKSWGPNILLFGVGLSTNFEGDGAFSLQIGHRLPWITSSGLSWRNDIVLGTRDLGWRTELRQPLFGSSVYIAPYASVRRNDVNLYADDETALPLASYVQQNLRAGIDIGVPLGNWGEARVGVAQVHTSYQPRSSVLTAFDNGDGSAFVQSGALSLQSTTQTVGEIGLKVDQLDDVVFPRRGFLFDAGAQMSIAGSNGSADVARVRALWAASRGRFSVNAAVEAGGQVGGNRDAPAYLFSLGGFQHLSAYAQDQFSGPYILYGRLTGFAQISKADTGPMRGIFTGVSLEGGNVWGESQRFARGPWLSSVSAFVGTTTMIGPLHFGFAMAPGGVRNVYFQLGNRF